MKGVAYYKNLIQALHAANIIPMVCMFHWDIPEVLVGKGGYESPQFPQWFQEYARVLFVQFGPMVKYWFTHNEPLNMCPGDGEKSYICAHSILRSHGIVYRMYQKEFKAQQGGKYLVSFGTFFIFEIVS